MKVYLDSEFKCHTINDGTMTEAENDFFNNKCDAFIEGYRYVPIGATWTRYDGEVFRGEMISPWKDFFKLDIAQRMYERQMLADYEAALAEIEAALGV